MQILFVQPRFPGQYRHQMRALAAEGGHRIVCLHDAAMANDERIPGVETHAYTPPPQSASGPAVLHDVENAVRRAENVAEAAKILQHSGFRADVVCAHSGYGEGLFLKEVFAKARHVSFFEYYYNASGTLGFDPEFAPYDEQLRRAGQVRNAVLQMALEAADVGVTPTRWQHSLFPAAYRSKLHVIHDGIDTDAIAPDPDASFALPDGRVLRRGDPVVTFCARALEPLRGIHSFLRALPTIMAARPDAQIVVVGKDMTAYGRPPASGVTHWQRLLSEQGGRIDRQRLHVMGWLPRADLTRLFQVTAAHVYLTYPFVLSWSMLEAMAAGALVVGSNTPPVRDVIRHGENGLLVDFFSPEDIARGVIGALRKTEFHQGLRQAARETVLREYAFAQLCWPRHRALLQGLSRSTEPFDASLPQAGLDNNL